MKKGMIISMVLFVLGLGFCGIAVASYFSQKNFQATAVATTGMVTNLKWVCVPAGPACNKGLTPQSVAQDSGFLVRHDSHWAAYPQVEFMAADRKTYLFDSKVGSNPASYAKGQAVTVLYSPQNPSNAQISGSSWTLILIFGILGLIVFLIGVLGIWGTIRGKRGLNNPQVNL